MASAEDIRVKEDRMMVELADLAMELARDAAGLAKAAKEAGQLEEVERCTQGFDRLARSVRLSVSLRRRLERDDLRDRAERRSQAADLKKAKLRARLRSEIGEQDLSRNAQFDLERELDDRLAEHVLYQSFLDLPFDEAAAKLRERLDLPDPPPQGDRVAVEAVETRSDLSGLQPPRPAAPGAPPEGEQPRTPPLKPVPS